VLDAHGVVAKSFARVHEANLINFGVLPLQSADLDVYDRPDADAELAIVGDAVAQLRGGDERLSVSVDDDWTFEVAVDLTPDERRTVLAGGKPARLKREG
jgi:aconitate hydratase